MKLNDQVRETLTGLMAQPDRPQKLHARRLEGLLKDLCPGCRPEIHVLLCGLHANAPGELSKLDGDVDIVLARLVERLQENYAIEGSAAGWAVEAWAVALGVIPPEEAGGRHWPSEDETPAANPEAPTWDPRQYLVVAADGSGAFTSIRAAIAALAIDQKIIVKPGLYRESLRISEALQLLGDGDPAEIILESTHEDTLVMETDTASVEGMTIRAVTTSAAQPFHAVVVNHGRLRLSNCRVASAGQSAVLIQGQSATPHFFQCLIGDGPGRGVVCSEMCRPVFAECEIFGHVAACVAITQWAAPIFQRCRIHGSRVNGVLVSDYGLGHFTDCDIYDHWLSGVAINTGGNPTLDRCRVHNVRAHGIWISERGEGVVKNCTLYENGRGGIYVEPGCKPRISANEVRQ
jgi:F-box protein 11